MNANAESTEEFLVNDLRGSRMLGLGRSTFRELAARGEIGPTIRIGRAVRWHVDDIKAWADKQRSQSETRAGDAA